MSEKIISAKAPTAIHKIGHKYNYKQYPYRKTIMINGAKHDTQGISKSIEPAIQ